jgi:hypothetical protein
MNTYLIIQIVRLVRHAGSDVLDLLGSIGVAVGMIALMRQTYNTIISTVVTGRVIDCMKKGHGRKARYHFKVSYTDKTGTERTVRGTQSVPGRDTQMPTVNQPYRVRYETKSPDSAELDDSFGARFGFFLAMVVIGVGCFILSGWIQRARG